MFNRLAMLAAAQLLMVMPDRAQAATLYDQPYTAPCACWASHISSSQGGFQTWDNFTLTQSSKVKSISWQGFYLDLTQQLTPGAPNTDLWEIGFYADNAGLPGAQIALTSLASPIAVQIDTGSFSGSPLIVYSFTVKLAAPLALTAGTQYWVSPLSRTAAGYQPLFGWALSTPSVDAMSYQVQTTGATFIRTSDRAFQLSGAVPEPGSWALMIGGFALAGAMLRNRRARQLRLA